MMRYAVNGMLVYPMINERPVFIDGKQLGSYYSIKSMVDAPDYEQYAGNDYIFATEEEAISKLLTKMNAIGESYKCRLAEISELKVIPA